MSKMNESLTYFLFKDSVVLTFKDGDSVETETISVGDPRYQLVVELVDKKEYGEIPDVVQRGKIKELLRFR